MKHKYIITMSFMITVLLSGLLGPTCKSLTGLSGGEELEGWRSENGLDVYYMRIAGRASEKAVEKDDYAMKKNTCVESTRLVSQDTIIRKMLGEQMAGASSTMDGEAQGFVVTSLREGFIKGVNMKECASIKDKWLNCECVFYISGKNLKKEFEAKVGKAQEDLRSR